MGCETALHLLETGAEEVTIVEMLDDILKDAAFAANVLMKLRHMIAESGVKVITGASVKEIFSGGLTYEKNDKTVRLECDTIVTAVGLKPRNDLEAALEGRVRNLTVIGDAVSARKVLTSVHEGYHAIRVFE